MVTGGRLLPKRETMAPSERTITFSIGAVTGVILGVGLFQYYPKHRSIIAALSVPLPPDGDHKRGSEILKYGFPGTIESCFS